MLLKGSDIIGLKIISMKENKEIGQVKDIIYDPKKNKVIGLLVSEGDVLTEPKLIPFSEIKEMAKETILVKSSQSLKQSSKVVKPISTSDHADAYLRGTIIITEEGKELGKENDIIFDTKSGQVQQFEVRQGNITHRVKIANIITSSETATIIKPGEPKQGSEENSGIIQKFKQLISQ